MSVVNVNRVEVLNNPASPAFQQPFAFEIEYECTSQLQDDLEWKMVYVGSAESEQYDQVLDSVLVGPVYPGQYKFVFEGNPPDVSKLRSEDVVGVTVILLTCSYKGKEFIRIGYYLNNDYEEEALRLEPPQQPQLDKLTRSILASDPRVTRFPADFDAAPEPVDVDMRTDDDPTVKGDALDINQLGTAVAAEMLMQQGEGMDGDDDVGGEQAVDEEQAAADQFMMQG